MQILGESLWFMVYRCMVYRRRVKKQGTQYCVPCLYLFKDICWFISQQHLEHYTYYHSKEYVDSRFQ
jgi:hypothetical protein